MGKRSHVHTETRSCRLGKRTSQCQISAATEETFHPLGFGMFPDVARACSNFHRHDQTRSNSPAFFTRGKRERERERERERYKERKHDKANAKQHSASPACDGLKHKHTDTHIYTCKLSTVIWKVCARVAHKRCFSASSSASVCHAKICLSETFSEPREWR